MKPFHYENDSTYMDFWQQQKAQAAYQERCMEIQKAQDFERIKSIGYADRLKIRIQYEFWKRQSQLEHEEKKRAIFQQVQISTNGQIFVTTKNLSPNIGPRELTNMHSPRLIEFSSLRDEDNIIWCVCCQVGEKPKSIFLNAKKTGMESYLVQQFQAQGVIFYVKQREKGQMIHQILAQLMRTNFERKVLPEYPGWVRVHGQWSFYKEDQLTWNVAAKKI